MEQPKGIVAKTRGKGRPPKADLIAVKERNKGRLVVLLVMLVASKSLRKGS